ncbi:MAG: amidase [Siculibacillus sp.]|nr:amidase [Siculibacillus sp.]
MSIERLLWEEDATGLAARVKAGEVAPAELVEAAIGRAERLAPVINPIAERLYERAREKATTIDRAAPFAGVPFAMKDIGATIAGVPLHSGSRIPPHLDERSSTVFARAEAAGLVTIATTTTPEWGLRLVTETARFGITRNPWNPGHTTGGSSGGSAAAVAAGIVPVAHASDGGGSIRVPAACCGLVGLKTSRGRVPLTPFVTDGWHGFVVQHAVTRSVRDCAGLLDVFAGADGTAAYGQERPATSYAQAAAMRPGKLRIGVWRDSPLGLPVDPEVGLAMDTAVALARDAGHEVEEIRLPIGRDFLTDFARVVAGCSAGQLRHLEAEQGRRLGGLIERPTRAISRFGEMLSAGEHTAALMRLDQASIDLIRDTARFDAVFMPILAHPPVPVGGMDSKGLDLFLEEVLDKMHLTVLLRLPAVLAKLLDQSFWFTPWTPIANVTGQPSIALPVHVTAGGLPLGIQATGRPGDEATLIALAAEMEAASGWTRRRAPLEVP